MFVAFAAFLLLNNLAGQIYDPQFYIQTLREQDAYARFYNHILLDQTVNRTAEWALGGTPVVIQEDLEPLLREIIPTAFLQEQVEGNIFRAIEYLNEDAETLNLYLELEPILDRIRPALFGYIDRQIDQTQVVRPDPSRSISDQIAEVEVLVKTLTRELVRGRLPQAVPSVQTIPEKLRGPLFDEFMASILRDPSLDARIRRGLEENSANLRRQFVTGDTRIFLKKVARTVTAPLLDEALAQSRSRLDSKGRLDLISAVAEGSPKITEESLRRDIEEGRNRLNRLISRGRFLALVILTGSALGMAAVHLPNLAHSLRWPGLALLLTGLMSYFLGRTLESNVATGLGVGINGGLAEVFEISGVAAQLLADVAQAFALRLVEGVGNPGLILVGIGLLIFAGSFLQNYLRPDRRVR